MGRTPSPDPGEDAGSPQLVSLTLMDKQGTLYYAPNVPSEMLVRDFADAFTRKAGLLTLISPHERRLNPAKLRTKDGDLNPEATLRDHHIQDGAFLSIETSYPTETGIILGLDEVAGIGEFIGEAIASGVVGNAAYELLKATLWTVSAQLHQTKNVLLSKDEAVAVTRASLCLRFNIDEPGRLELLSADPVNVKFNPKGMGAIQSLRTLGPKGHRKASHWRCTFGVQEEALPPSVTVLVGISPQDELRPEIMFLLPNFV
jgi:hypothetical protein